MKVGRGTVVVVADTVVHSSTQVGHVLARVQGGLSALDCALAQGHHKVSGLETVPMLLQSVAKHTLCLT